MKNGLFFLALGALGMWFFNNYDFSSTPSETPSPEKKITSAKETEDAQENTLVPVAERRIKGELLDNDDATDGIHLYKQGSFNKALTKLKKELTEEKYKTTRDRSLAYIAKSYEYLKNTPEAKKVWQKLIQEHSQSRYVGDAAYFWAKYKENEGLKSSSLKFMKKAAEYPESIGGCQAALEMGQYYEDKGENHALDTWRMYSKVIRTTKNPEVLKSTLQILNAITDKLVFSRKTIPNSVFYQVQSGDNLTRIARKYDSSIGFIQEINQLKNPQSIRINQQLKIIPGTLRVEVRKKHFFLGIYLEDDLFIRGFYVGLGRDDRTPEEVFEIATKKEKPDWFKETDTGTIRIPHGDPRNVLGSHWLGFNSKPGISGFGIHGTVDPSSIGKNMSDGCIRLQAENLSLLFRLIPRGTKVAIRKW